MGITWEEERESRRKRLSVCVGVVTEVTFIKFLLQDFRLWVDPPLQRVQEIKLAMSNARHVHALIDCWGVAFVSGAKLKGSIDQLESLILSLSFYFLLIKPRAVIKCDKVYFLSTILGNYSLLEYFHFLLLHHSTPLAQYLYFYNTDVQYVISAIRGWSNKIKQNKRCKTR